MPSPLIPSPTPSPPPPTPPVPDTGTKGVVARLIDKYPDLVFIQGDQLHRSKREIAYEFREVRGARGKERATKRHDDGLDIYLSPFPALLPPPLPT